MKYLGLSMSLKRDVRHAKYNVSQVKASLTAETTTETLGEDVIEMADDIIFIIEKMTQQEIEDHKRTF